MRIVISPRAKIVLFLLLMGSVVIILLSVFGVDNVYNVKYVVLAPTIIVLFVILVISERHRREKHL